METNHFNWAASILTVVLKVQLFNIYVYESVRTFFLFNASLE